MKYYFETRNIKDSYILIIDLDKTMFNILLEECIHKYILENDYVNRHTEIPFDEIEGFFLNKGIDCEKEYAIISTEYNPNSYLLRLNLKKYDIEIRKQFLVMNYWDKYNLDETLIRPKIVEIESKKNIFKKFLSKIL